MGKFYLLACVGAAFVFATGSVLGQTLANTTEATVVQLAIAEVPSEAKKSGLGGKVLVKVTLDENGKPISASADSGPDWICPSVTQPDVLALRSAAINAAMKSEFSPALKDGMAVASMIRVDFSFPKPDQGTTRNADSALYKATRMPEGMIFTVADGNANDIPPPNYVGPAAETKDDRIKADKFVSDGLLKGKASLLPQPLYPPAARAVRAAGGVSVQVLILTDGSIFSAQPISGHPLLRSSTRIAACNAKFTPTTLQGIPVKVSGIITYNFVR